jgi:hypothetical protein
MRIWHPEQLRIIANLLREGLSASGIAFVMREHEGFESVTRNAIIGVVHRHPELMEIGFRQRPFASPRPKRQKPLSAAKGEPAPIVVGRSLDRSSIGARSLTDLASWHCRFPLWPHDAQPGGGERLFCAEIQAAGSSYCSVHHHLCVATLRSTNVIPLTKRGIPA